MMKLKGFMITLKAELYHDVYLMKQKPLSLKHIWKGNKSRARSSQSYTACLATNRGCSKKKKTKKKKPMPKARRPHAKSYKVTLLDLFQLFLISIV